MGAVSVAALHGTAGATAPASKFCDRLSPFSANLPASLTEATPAKAGALARLLARAYTTAPKATRAAVAKLRGSLKVVIAAADDAARNADATSGDPGYRAALAALRAYESKYCPASLPTSPHLPGVVAAGQTACLQDQALLKQAEDLYSTVNGGFAAMSDLVSSQYLRQVSSYYADVRIDDPPGGYTLIAVADGPCANVPVAG
jgi:hypothetical protein